MVTEPSGSIVSKSLPLAFVVATVAVVASVGVLLKSWEIYRQVEGNRALNSAIEATKKENPTSEQAQRLFRKACSYGNATACGELLYSEKRDATKAFPVLDGECRKGDGWACTAVGRIAFESDDDSLGGSERAVEAFSKACAGGESVGCKMAAMVIMFEGREKDPSDESLARGRSFAERGCSLGYIDSCRIQALYYKNGIGGAKRSFDAAQLYTKVCNEAGTQGCTEAGDMMRLGNGIPENFDGAFFMYSKGCENDLGASCYGLGLQFLAGAGIHRNQVEGFTLVEKSCRLGYGEGCFLLASELFDGTYIRKDEVRAREFATMGCRAKHAQSCRLVGDANP